MEPSRSNKYVFTEESSFCSGLFYATRSHLIVTLVLDLSWDFWIWLEYLTSWHIRPCARSHVYNHIHTWTLLKIKWHESGLLAVWPDCLNGCLVEIKHPVTLLPERTPRVWLLANPFSRQLLLIDLLDRDYQQTFSQTLTTADFTADFTASNDCSYLRMKGDGTVCGTSIVNEREKNKIKHQIYWLESFKNNKRGSK